MKDAGFKLPRVKDAMMFAAESGDEVSVDFVSIVPVSSQDKYDTSLPMS